LNNIQNEPYKMQYTSLHLPLDIVRKNLNQTEQHIFDTWSLKILVLSEKLKKLPHLLKIYYVGVKKRNKIDKRKNKRA